MHAYLCPVFLLIDWLSISGIVSGPIFPNLVTTHNVKVPLVASYEAIVLDSKGSNLTVLKDAAGNVVNIPVETWNNILNTIFLIAGFPTATPHSIRRSAAQWASRCGAESYQIQNAGRWSKESTSWRTYVSAGHLEINRYFGRVDPIRALWVFHAISYDSSIRAELDM